MRNWPLLAMFALAGALAVPVDPVLMPAAAALALVLAWLGLRVWRWSRLPESISSPPRAAHFAPLLWLTVGLGVGLVLLAVLRAFLEPDLPAIGARLMAARARPLWQTAIVIYCAALGEELVFRLLLFSALARAVSHLLRTPVFEVRALWTANLLSALAFGIAHLPAWTVATNLTPGLAAAVIALNAAGGLVIGHVFARQGIVAAIVVHAGADVAVQVIGPWTG